MDAHVFLAVLAAALCHAGWNAGLKIRLPPAVAITLISVAAGLIALPLLAVFGVPRWDCWPFMAGSLLLHLAYYTALAEAYRTGDLGQVYPIARGSAPLLTALGSAALWSELLTIGQWLGVVLLAGGVILLAFRGGRLMATVDKRAIGFALLTAITIASYTLVDGQGARASGNAHAYTVLLFVLDGLMMAIFGLAFHRRAIVNGLSGNLALICGGALLSLASYWITIWAMSVSSIALVAAVRESSVLFAAAIGLVFLKEPLVPARIVAAVLVTLGLLCIRLA